ncbi:hypothetical protein HPB51_002747 [Rhipicephalus microplus]|uniref:CCHC-type domain-containing protein n=1 Tax=Rhipicephalus microplus TaxID=6941 RepID=A0A9J6EWQ3_RHIMP|nr:hypothetical protein HPB51_002747 [Rhipicephalus microplus]
MIPVQTTAIFHRSSFEGPCLPACSECVWLQWPVKSAARSYRGGCGAVPEFVSGIILAVAPSKGIAILSPGSVARITCVCYQATCPYATTAAAIPTARQRWNTCYRCAGIGQLGRECSSGRRNGLPRCYQCNRIARETVPKKQDVVGATPASTYETALRVAAVTSNKEPLLEVRIGQTAFLALLDR